MILRRCILVPISQGEKCESKQTIDVQINGKRPRSNDYHHARKCVRVHTHVRAHTLIYINIPPEVYIYIYTYRSTEYTPQCFNVTIVFSRCGASGDRCAPSAYAAPYIELKRGSSLAVSPFLPHLYYPTTAQVHDRTVARQQ